MATVYLDVDALYAAVDAKRRARDMSWRQVAEVTSLTPALFSRLKGGMAKPDVDALLTICRWVGMEASVFSITRTEHPSPTPIVFNPRGLSHEQLRILTTLAEAAELVARRRGDGSF